MNIWGLGGKLSAGSSTTLCLAGSSCLFREPQQLVKTGDSLSENMLKITNMPRKEVVLVWASGFTHTGIIHSRVSSSDGQNLVLEPFAITDATSVRFRSRPTSLQNDTLGTNRPYWRLEKCDTGIHTRTPVPGELPLSPNTYEASTMWQASTTWIPHPNAISHKL